MVMIEPAPTSRDVGAPDAGALDARSLVPVTTEALRSAARALSEITMRDVAAVAPTVRIVELASLSSIAGDPERAIVAVYLGVQGDARGHMLLAFGDEMAGNLVDMMLDQPEGTTVEMGELEISALAESGNIAGSSFLTTLAEWAELTLLPTTPVVIREMCGAILGALGSELAIREQDEAVVVETQLCCDGSVADAAFYMVPGEGMVGALLARAAAGDGVNGDGTNGDGASGDVASAVTRAGGAR